MRSEISRQGEMYEGLEGFNYRNFCLEVIYIARIFCGPDWMSTYKTIKLLPAFD